ncbi:MAG: hypothetical protein IJ835_00505 [Muribaculaceae bacterium]|nr:hypothetical protein [Muribaculaceae bacterium]
MGNNSQQFFRTSEVRCAQFYGTKVEKPIRNYQVFTGSLFEMIDKAVGFVMSRIDARVGTRNQSVDAPVQYELPESAVAEAIANAVAHRDYSSNGSVQVMLFRDRLEVWNPGRLPDGFTVHKLREVHSSEPTNPVIAHPLFLAGYIEHLGTGTTDIIAACEQYGLCSPEFIQAEDFRTIIYRRAKVTDLDGKSNQAPQENKRARLTTKQRKVLEFCDETPRTAQEILDMLGLKNQFKTRQQYTTRLVSLGVLRPTTTSPNNPNRKYITSHDEQ